MTIDTGDLVDWKAFQACRAQLGTGFVRILGYFEEDGKKSIALIENAMRAQKSTKKTPYFSHVCMYLSMPGRSGMDRYM